MTAPPAVPAPWDMRPDESAKAYQAFAVYRDAGPNRSLADTGQKLGKNLTTLGQWSVKYAWPDRARAFDAEAARRAAAKSLNDHAEVRARQAQLGRLLQAKGADRMAKLDPLELAPAEAIRAVDMGAKIERDALGLAVRHEHTGAEGGPITTRIVIEYDDGPDAGDVGEGE